MRSLKFAQITVQFLIFFVFTIFPFVSRAANLPAFSGEWNAERLETVDVSTLPLKKGLSLKPGIEPLTDYSRAPDLILRGTVPEAGTYRFWSRAAADAETKERLRVSHSKMDSIPIRMSVNGGLVSARYIIEPWRDSGNAYTRLGLFDLPAGELELRIWLPKGAILESISFSKYTPPQIPAQAENYTPPILPPANSHPRILVRPELLPTIRERLTQGENLRIWEMTQARAKAPIHRTWSTVEAVGHDAALLHSIEAKAFVYLISGDETIGREAVEWTVKYLKKVEYGNLLDITREMGMTICAASWVYDWCFPLLTQEEKTAIEQNLLRLAKGMECGWPPFGQIIVNGHGSEAQIMRDLLTMGIALYDVDPTPYRLCAWQVLEQLVPMRRWEYASPRHNQGVNYGNYRIRFEYFSDFLFSRMSGKRVFDENLAFVPLYFLNMRVPSGYAFPDGDCYNRKILRYAPAAFIMSAYCRELAQDPDALKKLESAPFIPPFTPGPAKIAQLMKAQYLRERGPNPGTEDPIFFLLMNDPTLTPDFSFDSLPTAFDSGTRLGSQIIRTGWMKEDWLKDTKTADLDSLETVVELKGAGYSTRNHQHADSGAFQIYHRGWLAGDLGLYHFYGLPYDMNFNKRSSSHNVCLIYDENQPKDPKGTYVNDGGQLYPSGCPRTPQEAEFKEDFQTGRVLKSVFEPSAANPKRSVYAVDLTASYRDRAKSYIRTFHWLRTDRADVPAVLVILDEMELKSPTLRRFWQCNTFLKPEFSGETLTAASLLPEGSTLTAPGRLAVIPLLPAPEDRKWELIGDERANSIFGTPFIVPLNEPAARGWRALLEDRSSDGDSRTVFLNVLQILDTNSDGTPASPLPVTWEKKDGKYFLTIGGESLTLDAAF